MRRAYTLSLSVALYAGLASLAYGQEPKAAKPPSLYQRLGGFDTLAAMFDDTAPRMAADPQFARFFAGHARDSDLRQRQRLLELLCSDTGGPCTYTGRPLKQAHTGLGVTEAHWNGFLNHFTAALDKLKIGAKEKGEILAMVGRYKSDVVEKP